MAFLFFQKFSGEIWNEVGSEIQLHKQDGVGGVVVGLGEGVAQ
jgi:hypothetical protein